MLNNRTLQTVLTYGLGLGIARFGINLIAMEVEGPKIIFESLPLAMIAMAVTITVMIGVGYKLRRDNGGILDLQTGLLSLLGLYALAGFIAAACNGLYFYVLQPDMMAKVSAYAERLTMYSMLREYISSLVFGSLLAVIFAFVLKREKVKVMN